MALPALLILARAARIALALGLASIGVAAPAIAGGNAGANGGDVHAGRAAPAIAGAKPGIASGSNEALADAPEVTIDGGRGGIGGEI